MLLSKSFYTFTLVKKIYPYFNYLHFNYLYETIHSIDLLIEPIDPIIDELRYRRDYFKI